MNGLSVQKETSPTFSYMARNFFFDDRDKIRRIEMGGPPTHQAQRHAGQSRGDLDPPTSALPDLAEASPPPL